MRNDRPSRIVSFVAASSNSGKTTLIEKIVRLLKARGLRVAVIKHASKGFDLDRPGKDSWRFREAGADTVVLVGPGQMAMVRTINEEPTDDELEQMIGADIVIAEGFKKSAGNRIEVFRAGVSGKRPLCMDDPCYIALVSDRHFEVKIPLFDLNDAEGVENFVVRTITG